MCVRKGLYETMGKQGKFVFSGGSGFCNAIRRTVLSDLKSEAPFQVEIRENTSCQTDEFIAHRIGLIPYRRVGNGGSITVCVRDRSVFSRDFTGSAFEPCVDVEIMTLKPGQMIDLTVRFDEQLSSKHARYCKCAAVGMERVDNDGRHKIVFETIDDSEPADLMMMALHAFETRVDDTLLNLSHRDLPPPKSMC